jgi:succinate dehydrogenase / fumarate reductase cytochrome b subunit
MIGFFRSSIGRKVSVALAGLLLCGFLLIHLAGNLLIFLGEGLFNGYAEKLEHNPILPAAEIGLLLLFLAHIAVSLKLRWENKQARPVAYAEFKDKGGRTWGSKTMTATAILVLVFLIIHIKTFRFGDASAGVYHMVMASFKNPLYAGFYVVAMFGLLLHLSHGFQSAFQTLGVNHPRATPWIKRFSLLFAILLAGGFASIPIWALLK